MGGQAVGGVVGCAGIGGAVDGGELAIFGGDHEVLCVNVHAGQRCAGRPTPRAGPRLDYGAIGREVHHFPCTCPGKQVGAVCSEQFDSGRGGKRSHPNGRVDVVSVNARGTVHTDVEDAVKFDQRTHVAGGWSAGKEQFGLEDGRSRGGEVGQSAAAIADQQGIV